MDDRLRTFRGDRVDTVEAGVHTTPSGSSRAEFALTLAYTFWRDIPADYLDGTGLPGTANIGDRRILTFEANGGIRLAEGLRANAAVTYNESSIVPGSDGRAAERPAGRLFVAEQRVQLQRVPNVAPLTGRIGATYDGTLGKDILRIDGWVRYVGPSNLGIGSVLGQDQGDYIDNAITARWDFGSFGLTLGMNNLADTQGSRFALGTPVATGRSQVTPLRPRISRVGIDRKF